MQHDQCYDQFAIHRQLNRQAACDNMFCECLKQSTTTDNWYCRRVATPLLCDIVHGIGHQAYRKAVNAN
jgi:hypothetical protein